MDIYELTLNSYWRGVAACIHQAAQEYGHILDLTLFERRGVLNGTISQGPAPLNPCVQCADYHVCARTNAGTSHCACADRGSQLTFKT